MTTLDEASGELVVRIVYDGPPLSGKTTSVRALATSLGREVVCPAEEDGRTVYFDFLEYTAGWFEGHAIRCQVISVPGQWSRRGRRLRLIDGADALVCLVDTTRDALPRSLEHLRQLPPLLEREGPPVGFLVQANKRDHADAVPMEEVRAALRARGVTAGVVETVASDGSGVRECFVFAVRLALDRARALMSDGRLPKGPPDHEGADDLFSWLEGDAHRPAASPARGVAPAPLPPGSDAPVGGIWPPVEGRVALHDAGFSPTAVARTEAGWRVDAERMTATSTPEDAFASFDAGRERLLDWVRHLSALRPLLSDGRCVALTRDGRGGWRVWQVYPRLVPLASERASPDLGEAAGLLRALEGRRQELGGRLALSLETIADTAFGPRYIAAVPPPGTDSTR